MREQPIPVGVVGGHGGPTLAAGLTRLPAMLRRFDVREVELASEVDPELRALLIVEPIEPLAPAERERIERFVARGRGLGVLGGRLHIDLTTGPSASQVETGINALLERWGIALGEGMIADASCGRVPMRSSTGVVTPVPYPPAAITVFDPEQRDHPVTANLTTEVLSFASPIETSAAFERQGGRVLAISSEEGGSWLLTGSPIPLQPRDPQEWSTTRGERLGPFAQVVALESGGARVLVIATSSILRDEFVPGQDHELGPLARRAVEWLTADAELAALWQD